MKTRDADAQTQAGAETTTSAGTLGRRLAAVRGFPLYVVRRFNRDGCFAASGALSYTTLLSLVPLGVIVLGILSAFPGFGSVRADALGLVFRNFVPAVGEEAARWVQTFADSATQTTALGVAGIAATGVLLLATIEDQLNVIWRVTLSRPWGQRILIYWTLITLGPLMVGTSLTLSAYFQIAARRAGFDTQALEIATEGWLNASVAFVPSLLELAASTLLYRLMPNCPVRWRDAIGGAVITTATVEALKIGFAIYIGSFAAYQTVYGALAAIPIFLLWMYVSWMAVLLGAVVAASLPTWRRDGRLADPGEAGSRLGFSLVLLAVLARARRTGAASRSEAMATELGASIAAVDARLARLARAGFAARTQSGGWVLARDLEIATLGDLYHALDLPLAARWKPQAQARWQHAVTPAMARIVAAETVATRLPLAPLIAEIGPGAAAPNREIAEATASE